MKRLLNVFLISLFTIPFCYGQSQSGDLEAYLKDFITGIPGNVGNDYTPPEIGDLEVWQDALSEIFDGNITMANDLFEALNYQVVEYIDSKNLPGQLYYILEEKTPQNKHWGTYVFNTSPCRDELVLQAPHPRFDTNTGFEAIHCFVRLSARALFLSGTHRCNHSSPSSCDGTTSVCGTSAAYRISDLAHNTASPFHITTEELGANNPETIFFQLHGFSKQDTDPFVILSNGTRETPAIDYALMLSEKLSAIDSELTFKIGHIDQDWNRLLGFTNTQSRYLNQSSFPCSMVSTETTGRFIHVEQERLRLRQDSIGWDKMYGAFKEIFSCIPVSFNESFVLLNEVEVYPNPTNSEINIVGRNIQKVSLMSTSGRLFEVQDFSNESSVTLNLQFWQPGIFILVVQEENRVSSKKILLERY